MNFILTFISFIMFFGFQSYGFFIFLGILLCISFCILLSKNKKIDIVDLLIYLYAFSFLGGKIFFIIFDNEGSFKNITFDLIIGGFSLLGASMGGILGILYYLERNKIDQIRLIHIPICALLVHGCGRIGCFFSGCCEGLFYSIYVTILSALFYFISFFIGLFLYKFNKLNTIIKSLCYYSICIFLDRFLFDQFRDDAIFIYSFITKYQILSFLYLLFILNILYLYTVYFIRSKSS